MNTKYNLSKKDEIYMYRMVSIIIIWFIVLIVSLFLWHSTYICGIWFLILGICMRLNRKSYAMWYSRVYETNRLNN